MQTIKQSLAVQYGLPYVGMKPTERALITFILTRGRNCAWVFYGGHDVADELAFKLQADVTTVSKALPLMYRKGWLVKRLDEVGRPMLQLTPLIIDRCIKEYERSAVRDAIGRVDWQRIKGNDELADEIFEQWDPMKGTLKRQVKEMVKLLKRAVPAPPPSRVRTGKKRLRAIDGEAVGH